ncbi:hypothetical protein KBD87_02240 [Candidatus Saccharibacteria bacterium]|nr:hypothetical protein [Candidatus Saccharibacteria bacterium]
MTTKKHIKARQVGAVLAVLAVVASPAVASAALDTKSTTINVTVNPAISMTTSTTVALTITPTSGGAVSSNSDTVTVSTNRATGYNLKLADSDATTTLVSGANTFTAMVTTWGSPATLTNGKWGYGIASGTAGLTASSNFDASYSAESSNASSTSKWLGVASSASPQTLKTTAAAASGDVTTVWYAAKADLSQPESNGTPYTDSVTYTATTN